MRGLEEAYSKVSPHTVTEQQYEEQPYGFYETQWVWIGEAKVLNPEYGIIEAEIASTKAEIERVKQQIGQYRAPSARTRPGKTTPTESEIMFAVGERNHHGFALVENVYIQEAVAALDKIGEHGAARLLEELAS